MLQFVSNERNAIKTMRKHVILFRPIKIRILRRPSADRDVGHRNISAEIKTDTATAGKNLAVSG